MGNLVTTDERHTDRRRIRVNQSGMRPTLLMGGDRNLMLLLLIVCGWFILGLQTRYSIAFGIIAGFLGVIALRKLAAYDPLFHRVYMRHIKYRAQYRSHSRPWTKQSNRWS